MTPTFRLASCAITALCVAGLPLAPAQAQMPVLDPANLAQNIQQAAHALEQIKNQVKELEALTSHEGYGALADGATERALRRYAPESWEDSLRILEAGGLPGDSNDVASIVGDLRDRYAPLSADELAQARVSDETRASLSRSQATGLMAEGISSTAFAQIETRIGNVELMLGQIDAAPDIKAAQDLEARITGEVALAQLELVRLQALSGTLQAQEMNRRTAAQARMQRFLNAPDALAADTVALEPQN